jgi:hypothetical protein
VDASEIMVLRGMNGDSRDPISPAAIANGSSDISVDIVIMTNWVGSIGAA